MNNEKEGKVCAGIDIGGTKTEIGLVDRAGNILFSKTISTKSCSTAERFVSDATAILREGVEQTGTVLLSTGIGAPSANYFSGSIENAPNMPWKGIVPLAQLMKDASGFPCILNNDAKAAAIGEHLFGAAKGLRNFVVVTLGTGLGSGFVVNDEVLYGHDGFAGELGHVIIEHNGRKCGCGRNGCLETYVSATGIVTTAREWLEFEGEQSTLKAIPFEQLESRHIAEAAEKGDRLALRLMDFTAEKLGFALANMVAVTSPSHIFLYGGLAKAGKYILEPARHYFEEYLLQHYKGKVQLGLSGLPDKAAVLGAAALAWKEAEQLVVKS